MTDKNQVILEEIMIMALDNAIRICSDQTDDFNRGRLMAFYEVLSVAKEQAELMEVVFDDNRLNSLNPEELLKKPLMKAA